jgi:hypothetical protein
MILLVIIAALWLVGWLLVRESKEDRLIRETREAEQAETELVRQEAERKRAEIEQKQQEAKMAAAQEIERMRQKEVVLKNEIERVKEITRQEEAAFQNKLAAIRQEIEGIRHQLYHSLAPPTAKNDSGYYFGHGVGYFNSEEELHYAIGVWRSCMLQSARDVGDFGSPQTVAEANTAVERVRIAARNATMEVVTRRRIEAQQKIEDQKRIQQEREGQERQKQLPCSIGSDAAPAEKLSLDEALARIEARQKAERTAAQSDFKLSLGVGVNRAVLRKEQDEEVGRRKITPVPKPKKGCPRCGGPSTLVSGFIICSKCGHRRGEQQLSRAWASGGADPLLFLDSEPPSIRPAQRGDWPIEEKDND